MPWTLAARAESDKVSQFSGNVLGWEQEVEIFNSEGAQVADRRHYNRIMASRPSRPGRRRAERGLAKPLAP